MRKILFICVVITLAICIASCSKKKEEVPKIQRWEYNTISVMGNVLFETSLGNEWCRDFTVPLTQIDSLGNLGWELVDTYTLTETVHPNFGNEKYVTGIKANTRTQQVIYVFKRPLR